MKPLYVVAVLIFIAGSLSGYLFNQATLQSLPISVEGAIASLEVAKQSHDYYAIHYGDDVPWSIVPGQDALWAERYGEIIGLIRILDK